MSFQHVNDLWDDAAAAALSPLELLARRSNWLGTDPRLTHTGGGSVSCKLVEKDPITGQSVEVLWVTGAGGDLRTAAPETFSSLCQQKLLDLPKYYAGRKDKGIKSPAEDGMVALYPRCAFHLNPRPPCMDTPLHSFLPARNIDHLHPNAILAIAASRRGEELTAQIFGGEMAWLPWMRPGFELGLAMQEMARRNPRLKGIMLGWHGFVSWDDDAKACYLRTLQFIEKAAAHVEKQYAAKGGHAKAFGGARYQSIEFHKRNWSLAQILPWLRGQISQRQRVIATVQNDDDLMRFVNSRNAHDLAELGPSCPDHLLRARIKPLYVNWNPQAEDLAELKLKLAVGLEQYRKDYAEYYLDCKHLHSPPMRDFNPAVVLIPGLGMVAWGRDKSESRLTAELYNAAVEVMRGAEAIDEYTALPRQEAFDLEYGSLEEAEWRRLPAEKELARQVVIVAGAGSGIGRETALRLAREGAQVVCVDLNATAASATAKGITDQYGLGIGVAGSGISGCGPAIGLGCDITRRGSIRAMLDQTALAYGGFDSICVTAGIAVPGDAAGRIPDDQWAATFAVNVTGSYLLADEAGKTWKEQELPGNLVLTSSAGAVAAGRGSLAGDASKAAASHLARELAVELAPLVRVNGVAPGTVVQGSALFPRDRVIAVLAEYKISFTEGEATESLVRKLAQFYADRTLTKSPPTAADAAEAYFLLVSNRLSKTTGQIIPVDGGLPEAFLR
jgi:rhamnulose-1-phosphate aldolase/alcohol dehydrogenase